MKLEDVLFKVSISCNRGTAKERGKKFIKEIKKWAKELVPKKQNEDVSVIDRETDAANYASFLGHNNCRKEMLKNIEEG